jgi:hypothetical protein
MEVAEVDRTHWPMIHEPCLSAELEDADNGGDPDWNAKAMALLAAQLGIANDFFYPCLGACNQLRQQQCEIKYLKEYIACPWWRRAWNKWRSR